MGCDSGMKAVSAFVGFALVDPKWLEESYSQTASAAAHIESNLVSKMQAPT